MDRRARMGPLDMTYDPRGQRIDVEVEVGDWNPFEETNPNEVLKRFGLHLARLAKENAVRFKTNDLIGFITLLPEETEIHAVPRDVSILEGKVADPNVVDKPAGPDAIWVVIRTPQMEVIGRMSLQPKNVN